MNASLHWIYWIIHVSYLAFVFRKIAQVRTPCKMTWPTRADWRSNWSVLKSQEQDFSSSSQKQNNRTEKPKSDRWERTRIFSLIVLIQHITKPDVAQDRFMLFVVYCSLCARTAHVVRWPEARAFEDEPTKYGRRKETEVKMNFSFTRIRMLPSLTPRQQLFINYQWFYFS